MPGVAMAENETREKERGGFLGRRIEADCANFGSMLSIKIGYYFLNLPPGTGATDNIAAAQILSA